MATLNYSTNPKRMKKKCAQSLVRVIHGGPLLLHFILLLLSPLPLFAQEASEQIAQHMASSPGITSSENFPMDSKGSASATILASDEDRSSSETLAGNAAGVQTHVTAETTNLSPASGLIEGDDDLGKGSDVVPIQQANIISESDRSDEEQKGSDGAADGEGYEDDSDGHVIDIIDTDIFSAAIHSPECAERCVTESCSGHGRCVGDSCECVCGEGYTGDHCENRVATISNFRLRRSPKPCPDNCSGNGECHYNGTCTCSRGWAGYNCSLECAGGAANPCSGHGTCNMSNGKCVCDEGYAGKNCTRRDVPQDVNEYRMNILGNKKKEEEAKHITQEAVVNASQVQQVVTADTSNSEQAGEDAKSENKSNSSVPNPVQQAVDKYVKGVVVDEKTLATYGVNHAAYDLGSKALASNKDATGLSSLLRTDKDKYWISPCKLEKGVMWVVIELSEIIHVHTIVLGSFEYYSSTVNAFQVLGQLVYPTDQWNVLGHFYALPTRQFQEFKLSTPVMTKYLKFRFLSYHGKEFYCTLSSIKVYGRTQWEEMGRMLDANEEVVEEAKRRLVGAAQSDNVTESQQPAGTVEVVISTTPSKPPSAQTSNNSTNATAAANDVQDARGNITAPSSNSSVLLKGSLHEEARQAVTQGLNFFAKLANLVPGLSSGEAASEQNKTSNLTLAERKDNATPQVEPDTGTATSPGATELIEQPVNVMGAHINATAMSTSEGAAVPTASVAEEGGNGVEEGTLSGMSIEPTSAVDQDKKLQNEQVSSQGSDAGQEETQTGAAVNVEGVSSETVANVDNSKTDEESRSGRHSGDQASSTGDSTRPQAKSSAGQDECSVSSGDECLRDDADSASLEGSSSIGSSSSKEDSKGAAAGGQTQDEAVAADKVPEGEGDAWSEDANSGKQQERTSSNRGEADTTISADVRSNDVSTVADSAPTVAPVVVDASSKVLGSTGGGAAGAGVLVGGDSAINQVMNVTTTGAAVTDTTATSVQAQGVGQGDEQVHNVSQPVPLPSSPVALEQVKSGATDEGVVDGEVAVGGKSNLQDVNASQVEPGLAVGIKSSDSQAMNSGNTSGDASSKVVGEQVGEGAGAAGQVVEAESAVSAKEAEDELLRKEEGERLQREEDARKREEMERSAKAAEEAKKKEEEEAKRREEEEAKKREEEEAKKREEEEAKKREEEEVARKRQEDQEAKMRKALGNVPAPKGEMSFFQKVPSKIKDLEINQSLLQSYVQDIKKQYDEAFEDVQNEAKALQHELASVNARLKESMSNLTERVSALYDNAMLMDKVQREQMQLLELTSNQLESLQVTQARSKWRFYAEVSALLLFWFLLYRHLMPRINVVLSGFDSVLTKGSKMLHGQSKKYPSQSVVSRIFSILSNVLAPPPVLDRVLSSSGLTRRHSLSAMSDNLHPVRLCSASAANGWSSERNLMSTSKQHPSVKRCKRKAQGQSPDTIQPQDMKGANRLAPIKVDDDGFTSTSSSQGSPADISWSQRRPMSANSANARAVKVTGSEGRSAGGDASNRHNSLQRTHSSPASSSPGKGHFTGSEDWEEDKEGWNKVSMHSMDLARSQSSAAAEEGMHVPKKTSSWHKRSQSLQDVKTFQGRSKSEAGPSYPWQHPGDQAAGGRYVLLACHEESVSESDGGGGDGGGAESPVQKFRPAPPMSQGSQKELSMLNKTLHY